MTTPMGPPSQPSLPWRLASTAVMGMTGFLCRSFIYGLNTVEVIGLDKFLRLLESRRDVGKRQRGLITAITYAKMLTPDVKVMDDPIIWGILPLSFALDPRNLRWGLGSHDICYKNRLFANFFNVGQTLPTHRLNYSLHGGLFQSTMTQAIRLLSAQPYSTSPSTQASSSHPLPDPFTAKSLTYTTTTEDAWPAPSAYSVNRHAWVHIFPEGSIHQHRELGLKYFKWGISRLILESQPCPDVVPMFIDGTNKIMPEERSFPRFLPRAGNKLRITIGDIVDFEETFGDLRRRWERLVAKSTTRRIEDGNGEGQQTGWSVGELPEDLRDSEEAKKIRIEVALRMRNEILKLRKSRGYPDEDPSLGLAETWAEDPKKPKYRSPVDDSLINQD